MESSSKRALCSGFKRHRYLALFAVWHAVFKMLSCPGSLRGLPAKNLSHTGPASDAV